MDTFIIIVMLCTFDPYANQEFCMPLAENPKVYYKSEDQCNIAARTKRKNIESIAKEQGYLVSGVYSNCIKEGNNS